MRPHRHKPPYHHPPLDRTITTTAITTMLTMEAKEPTQAQGLSMEAETPIPTAAQEQEIPILVVILVHPPHMLINTATIKAVLQTLTHTKSMPTPTWMTRPTQPAQAQNQTKSTDIIKDRSRIRTMTMTIMDPKLSYQTQ